MTEKVSITKPATEHAEQPRVTPARESKMDVSALMSMLDKNRTPDASNRAKRVKNPNKTRLDEVVKAASDNKDSKAKQLENPAPSLYAQIAQEIANENEDGEIPAVKPTVEPHEEPAIILPEEHTTAAIPKETLEAIEKAKKYTDAEPEEKPVRSGWKRLKHATQESVTGAEDETPTYVEEHTVVTLAPEDYQEAANDIANNNVQITSSGIPRRNVILSFGWFAIGLVLFFGLIYTVDKQTHEWASKTVKGNVTANATELEEKEEKLEAANQPAAGFEYRDAPEMKSAPEPEIPSLPNLPDEAVPTPKPLELKNTAPRPVDDKPLLPTRWENEPAPAVKPKPQPENVRLEPEERIENTSGSNQYTDGLKDLLTQP